MEPTSYKISVKTETLSSNKTEVIGNVNEKVTEDKTESKIKMTQNCIPQCGTLQNGSELKESEIKENELRNDSNRTSMGISKEHKMTEQITVKITTSNTTTTLTKRQKYVTTTILFYVLFAYVSN